MATEVQFGRVNVSLPCMVPVVPGTPTTDAPIEERTETCNLNAWWTMGSAFICDYHLRELLDSLDGALGTYDEIVNDLTVQGWPGPTPPNAMERRPWGEQFRYDQEPKLLPVVHPVRKAGSEGRGA